MDHSKMGKMAAMKDCCCKDMVQDARGTRRRRRQAPLVEQRRGGAVWRGASSSRRLIVRVELYLAASALALASFSAPAAAQIHARYDHAMPAKPAAKKKAPAKQKPAAKKKAKTAAAKKAGAEPMEAMTKPVKQRFADARAACADGPDEHADDRPRRPRNGDDRRACLLSDGARKLGHGVAAGHVRAHGPARDERRLDADGAWRAQPRLRPPVRPARRRQGIRVRAC